MKLFTKLVICVAALLPTVGFAQSNVYTLDAAPAAVSPGDTVTVSWTTDASSVSRDWIGLYRANSGDYAYVSWQYVSGQTGSLDFVIPDAGDYEFRYFLNNGYTRADTSNIVTATAGSGSGGGSYDLSITASQYDVNEQIDVSWAAGGTSFSRDWVGLYQVGASDRSYRDWQYINAQSGTLTFTISDPGDYEFRYFLNNGYTEAATTNAFTVQASGDGSGGGGGSTTYDLSLSDTQIERGQTITVTWDTTASDIARDWIGLYETGASQSSYQQWDYVDASTGSLNFTPNRTGTYEFRYYLDNSYQLAAQSAAFDVVTPSGGGGGGGTSGYSLTPDQTTYDRGDTARVTWAVPSGESFFRNWIGLYRPGDPDTAYLDFEYVDIFSRVETFPLPNDGTFEFRFFTNNSYNQVATSQPIVVQNSTNAACTLPTGNITNFPPPTGPIVALGDSITFGVGSTAGEDYVSELEDRLGVNIVNEGISGDTTRDALARLDQDVLSRNPSAVIVFLGGNDEIRRFYDRLSDNLADRNLKDELDDLAANVGYDWMSVPLIPRAETFTNLETIINRIQATGATTILVGFDATIFDSQIDDDYLTIANNTGSFFVPDIYNGVFGRPSLMSDLVHPNDAGYDIVADRIQPVVACVAN